MIMISWRNGRSASEELAERVKEMPPSRAAEITWIPEDKIVESARMFATSGGAIQWGLAIDQTKYQLP